MARAALALSSSRRSRNVPAQDHAATNYNSEMKNAPRNGELLLLVPTGETETPLTREIGWYDHELKRWEGDWRYYDGPGGYAKAEPVGWAELPEIDAQFFGWAGALVPATRADSGVKLDKALAERAALKADKQAAARAEKRSAAAKPDPRPAKGKHGVYMTAGKPVTSKPKRVISEQG